MNANAVAGVALEPFGYWFCNSDQMLLDEFFFFHEHIPSLVVPVATGPPACKINAAPDNLCSYEEKGLKTLNLDYPAVSRSHGWSRGQGRFRQKHGTPPRQAQAAQVDKQLFRSDLARSEHER
jgi:hypothetical protein